VIHFSLKTPSQISKGAPPKSCPRSSPSSRWSFGHGPPLSWLETVCKLSYSAYPSLWLPPRHHPHCRLPSNRETCMHPCTQRLHKDLVCILQFFSLTGHARSNLTRVVCCFINSFNTRSSRVSIRRTLGRGWLSHSYQPLSSLRRRLIPSEHMPSRRYQVYFTLCRLCILQDHLAPACSQKAKPRKLFLDNQE
jgi:hypothetical protein